MFRPITSVEFLRLNFLPRPPINSRFANQVDGFLQAVTGVENHLVSTAIFRRSHDFVMKDDEDFHDLRGGNMSHRQRYSIANGRWPFRCNGRIDDRHLTTLVRQTVLSHSKCDSSVCQLFLPVLSWQVLHQVPDQSDLLLAVMVFDVLVRL